MAVIIIIPHLFAGDVLEQLITNPVTIPVYANKMQSKGVCGVVWCGVWVGCACVCVCMQVSEWVNEGVCASARVRECVSA